MLRRLWRRIFDPDHPDALDAHHVSRATRLAHQYHADTRGVDLPHWMTPQELAEVRRAEEAAERRAAMRMVGGGKR